MIYNKKFIQILNVFITLITLFLLMLILDINFKQKLVVDKYENLMTELEEKQLVCLPR